MKIFFYVFGMAAFVFGLLVLFRAMQTALAGEGFQAFQFVVGIGGVILATIWMKRAKLAK